MAADGDHSPLQTTPTRIASGPGYTPGNRRPVAIGKPPSEAIHPAKTTPAFIASGPADMVDNRRRMSADKPFSRTNDGASRILSGRARSGLAQPWSPSVCRRHAPARAGPPVDRSLPILIQRVTCDGERNDPRVPGSPS